MRTATLLLLLLTATGCRTKDDTGSDTGPDTASGSGTVDADQDGVLAADDCDDTDPAVFPGAQEVCNDTDDDCDDAVDEDVQTVFYADADGDGHGDATQLTLACEAPEGTVESDDDCDDTDDTVYPEAPERCDTLDNDCDLAVDESATDTWYVDSDGDGYGDTEQPVEACEETAATSAEGGDCDDDAAEISPAATELCDGVDNDCDDETDEPDAADALTWYGDRDGDGWADPADSTRSCEQPTDNIGVGAGSDWDCDDTDPAVNPDADEVCNGIDDDCDGSTDPDDSVDATTWYLDQDTDGHGGSVAVTACEQPSGTVSTSTDCDDLDPTISPDGTEACNGADDDCDGATDESGSTGETAWYLDGDGDGHGDPSTGQDACDPPSADHVEGAGDCDDTDAAVNPDATELCNGADDDCDLDVDEDGAADAATWWWDADGDGFGGSATTVSCEAGSGWVDNSADCDDLDAGVSPAGTETCDGADQDCDGTVDEDATDASTWFGDHDGDGHGDASDTWDACDAPTDYTDDDTDCDDADSDVYPGAAETCDGVDEDCDTVIDEDATDVETWYADDDGDGYGDPADTVDACDAPTGFLADSSDCDDADSGAYPGASETCDGVDEDCDGSVDEGATDGTASCPGTTCLDLITDDPGLASGSYTFDPDGDGTTFTASCEMSIDGGGWMQFTSDTAASKGSETREYLYTYSSGFYVSPATSALWNWSSYQAVEGTYTYGSGSTISGTFGCSNVEAGHWGIGCSNGGGGQWKVLPWGSGTDSTNGYSNICQDVPDVFGVGACAYPVQIWIRP